MSQHINIYTLAGVRLDVLPTETIEINMGGISLLNLQDRTATYSNTFSLPRTPINEREFAYACQPTRNNRPLIDVIVSKGLFQRKAKLKVIEFEGNYKCTVSYDEENVLKTLSELNYYTLPVNDLATVFKDELPLPTADEVLTAVSTVRDDGSLFCPFMYQTKVNNAAMTVLSFLSRITTLTGITFTGDMLTNANLLKTIIFNKYVYFEYDNTLVNPAGGYNIVQKIDTSETLDVISCGEVLKSLSQILLFDIKISASNIELISVENKIAGTPIAMEGFSNVVKQLYSGHALTNKITYKTDKTLLDSLGSDVFVGDGIGVKDTLKINAFIPIRYIDNPTGFIRGGYDPQNSEALKEIIIMSTTTISATTDYRVTWSEYSLTSSATFEGTSAEPLDIAPAYSDILDPIFTNPVILQTDKWFSPLEANNIMNTRVLLSVQLGGRYWVDSMANNLTTGQSKLTLIKLP